MKKLDLKRYYKQLVLIGVILPLLKATSLLAANSCNQYLSLKHFDIKAPLTVQINKLELPTSTNEIKPRFEQNKDLLALTLNSLSFFRESLEHLNGGKELFKIFEKASEISLEQFQASLNEWAKTFIPDYKLIFLNEVSSFPFANRYVNKEIPFYNPKTGKLDDKFLIELYANKKIPILSSTDLLTQILVFAQPKLREQIERVVNLYQHAQALGDLTLNDQLVVRRNTRPYANKNRLEYIFTLIEFLTQKMIFTNPYSDSKQLVLFGGDNLMAANKTIASLDIISSVDLSLVSKPEAMAYFNEQSELKNAGASGLFRLLTKTKILNGPATQATQNPRWSQQSFYDALASLKLIASLSSFESQTQKELPTAAWNRFSKKLYEDSNPITQITRYKFRFELIEHYIRIVENDLKYDERRAQKEQPGPLFR